jgi:plasmid maintenance system antidote protein VapI
MKSIFLNSLEDISSSVFIKHLIDDKKSKGINVSTRALAQRGDFSPSTLSRALSGEKRCTLDFADRLFKALKISSDNLYYLKKIILYETSSNEVIKERISRELITASLNFDLKKELSKKSLLDTFSSLQIDKVINYYNHEMMEQRSLSLLKNSKGDRVKNFFDTLISLQKSISFISYFIESKRPNYFDAYLDTLDDSRHGPFNVSLSNRELEIDFSKNGMPHVKAVIVHFIHETKFGVLDFEFSDSELKISGDVFDPLDSSYNEFYERKYIRIK